jgi:hypothetical protein
MTAFCRGLSPPEERFWLFWRSLKGAPLAGGGPIFQFS